MPFGLEPVMTQPWVCRRVLGCR
ncbi:hypothetical protein MJ560_17555 [Klebsiella pneumoniae]|nr:hypothetical protein MJ560_17555 [Klebsiella pneumoniae]